MPARSVRSFYLHLAIPGWQGRVLDQYDVTLRDALTHDTVLTVTPAELVRMLTHYVTHANITAGLLWQQSYGEPPRLPVASAPAAPALRAVGVPLRPVQEARRTHRRARSKGKRRAP